MIMLEISCCALYVDDFPLPELWQRALLSLKVLNEEQRRLTDHYPIHDAKKCEVCNIFYEYDALKAMIYRS